LWRLIALQSIKNNQEKKAMKNAVVAIPSSHPGGLNSALGAHFGHCDLYTLVEVVDGQVQEVRTLPNVPHQQGGCMAPVNHLAQNGVQVLIAGGMGMRPLMGFNQVGIHVLYGAGAQTVGDAVNAFLNGRLQQFTSEFTCGGGGGAPQMGRF
jgi:predicted Fe-Mo cluster-binding NifX family protein